MARWRLTEPHYINGHYPGMDVTEWEYKEIDRENGREIRKRFKVPAYFDRDQIVCHEGKGQRTDCVFEGDPTPSMEPLDDEAREITEACRPTWGEHAIESLPGQGFTETLLQHFQRKLDEVAAKGAPVVASGVSKEEFDTMKAQLAELMAQNAELKEKRGIKQKVA